VNLCTFGILKSRAQAMALPAVLGPVQSNKTERQERVKRSVSVYIGYAPRGVEYRTVDIRIPEISARAYVEIAHQGAPSAPVSPTRAGVGVSFVGGRKATLRRVLREKGVVLTVEAQARLDVLPEQFLDFVAAPESFAAQLEVEAA